MACGHWKGIHFDKCQKFAKKFNFVIDFEKDNRYSVQFSNVEKINNAQKYINKFNVLSVMAFILYKWENNNLRSTLVLMTNSYTSCTHSLYNLFI